jgi:hypothetical protein
MAGTRMKVGSTITTDTTSDPHIILTANASAPIGQPIFQTYDYLAAPVWWTGNSANKVSEVFGDNMAAHGGGGALVGFDGRNGRANPNCMFFPKNPTTTDGPRVFSGSGAPAVDTAIVGDIWIRTDTPGTANQRVYQCTTAGNPGTWTARL